MPKNHSTPFYKKVTRQVKKRYFKGKGYSAPKVTRMAKDIGYLKSVLNPEKKYKDTRILTTTTNLYPDDPFVDYFNLGGIAQGDDNSNRNGRSIKLSSIHLNLKIQHNGASAHVKTKFKFYIVKAKGTQPTTITRAGLLDLFFERSALDATRTDFTSFRVSERMTDFQIVASFSGTISSESVSGQNETKVCTLHRKMKHHVRWDSTNSIQDGELYIFGIADRGTDASNDGIVVTAMSCRAYWYDN